MKGLLLKMALGYDLAQANQQQFTPIDSQDPLNDPTGTSAWGYNSNHNWIIEPQLHYNAAISSGKLDVLLGGSDQQANTDGLYVEGDGYTSDNLLHNISSAATIINNDNYGEYKYAAVFGRINYVWDNKYIIDLNARRDGSSRFGPGRQFGNFGSVGAAWIFSEENFFSRYHKIFSFGKLRASYGTTGSDAVGDYEYLSRYTSNGYQPYNGSSVLAPTQAPNPNYQWQVNRKFEGAINLGLFKDRINLQAAFYRDRCGNQLVGFPLPTFTGFATTTANSPALVQNVGWEFVASAKIIDAKQFQWDINFNTAFNRNKLVSYPNFSQSPYVGSLVVGQPLNIDRLLKFTGVDPQTGQYAYYDRNHNGEVDIDYSGLTQDDRFIYNLVQNSLAGSALISFIIP